MKIIASTENKPQEMRIIQPERQHINILNNQNISHHLKIPNQYSNDQQSNTTINPPKSDNIIPFSTANLPPKSEPVPDTLKIYTS